MGEKLVFDPVYAVAWVIASGVSIYFYFLRAPAAVAVRPQLADAGFWTAAFSGRFTEWLFYTSPVAATVIVFAFWTLMATVLVVTS